MGSEIDKDTFKALLSDPDFDLSFMGTVAGDYLGGEVDAGKFDESDFAALQKAVRETDSYTIARFVVTCLERLYDLSLGCCEE